MVMTQTSDAFTPGRTAGAARRARAFVQARRHTFVVKFLRKAILFGSLAVIAGLVTLFDPFGRLPKEVSFETVRLDGSRVTLEAPRLAGYRQDGKPYNIRAASGVQDIRNPSVVELKEIEARFETNDQAAVRLTAPGGVYNSSTEKMRLNDDVRIISDKGFDMRMRNADLDFRAGSVSSDEPVTVVSGNGTIRADRLRVGDGGKRVSFEGNVQSVFTTTPEPAKGSDK
jgi:lipopolysaccharide export system protein LptC